MKLYYPTLPFFLLIAVFVSLLAGTHTPVRAQKSASDTVLSNGLRIGFDVGRIANYYLQNRNFFSLEASADVGYQRWLGVAELGYATITKEREQRYAYSGNGFFGRIGVERNLLKGGDDVVFWGLRYGVGQTTYEYSFYTVRDPVWGDIDGSVQKTSAMQHWGELVGGIKGQVLKNIYLGFTLRARVKIAGTYATETAPIIMPGYGNPLKGTTFGMNYYISYRIPFTKPATFPKKPKVKKTTKQTAAPAKKR
jgi:hypothetical protein